MISFLVAFSLEVLLYSNGSRAKLSVGLVLAGMVLLICWCVSTSMETRTNFGLLGRVQVLKDDFVDFTRRLRGAASVSESDAGDVGDGDGQCGSGVPSRSETFVKPSNQTQGLGGPTSSALVTQTGDNGSGSPDVTAVEMGEANNMATWSAV